MSNQTYSLSRFGEELVQAMPDRKRMAEVRRKWRKLMKKKQEPPTQHKRDCEQ